MSCVPRLYFQVFAVIHFLLFSVSGEDWRQTVQFRWSQAVGRIPGTEFLSQRNVGGIYDIICVMYIVPDYAKHLVLTISCIGFF